MRKMLLSSVALIPAVALIPFIASTPANATTVATIDGCYDCVVYDTPNLTFENTSGGNLVNAQMVLTGYQPGTLIYGITQTVNLGTLGPGNTNYTWLDGYPGTIRGDLTSYDFDNSYGNTPSGYTNPLCVVNSGLCSLVGNFSVTFTATISGGTFNGQPVFAVFSPTTNGTGGFIGWEGLDPSGLSETTYDQHSGSTSTVNGTLASIDLGTPPATPLPSSWTMMLAALTGFGFFALRAKKRNRGSSAFAAI